MSFTCIHSVTEITTPPSPETEIVLRIIYANRLIVISGGLVQDLVNSSLGEYLSRVL